jgi:RHS repeat-associated protein
VYQNIVTQMTQQAPLSKSLSDENSATCPLTLANGFASCSSTTADTFGIDPKFRIGYAQMWNFDVQRDLPFALQVTASYSGIKGTHAAQEILPNSYPLGARRVQTDYAGVVEQNCASLPFGDGESCAPLPTEHLFTGKERDTESGNDYFGARYYASSMGRWLSPDYTSDTDGPPDAVPYADLTNPQSLNLYGYVQNSPLSNFDSEGHDCVNASNAANGTISVQSTQNASDCMAGYTYVDGTVGNSYTYSNGQVGFNISNYADGSGTAGSVTMASGSQLDPDTLKAGVFGSPSGQTWTNGAGAVNTAGKAVETGFSFVFPLTFLAVDALSGTSPNGAQAAGISRKPGTLGMRKGTDALRAEDKLNLGPEGREVVHQLLQEGRQDLGRKMSFREGLEYVAKAIGKAL